MNQIKSADVLRDGESLKIFSLDGKTLVGRVTRDETEIVTVEADHIHELIQAIAERRKNQ